MKSVKNEVVGINKEPDKKVLDVCDILFRTITNIQESFFTVNIASKSIIKQVGTVS